ncbi:MAG: TetR/AcrR family transcriptional regulator [bacterium]
MPKIVDKVVKREEILQAALHAFAKKGFKNTKMIDIANESGIGKGTIYEYYRNKDEMLLAAFGEYIHLADAEVMAVLQGNLSPVAKIREIITKIIQIYTNDPELTRVFFDFWVAGLQNTQQPEIDFKPIYAQYRELTQKLLQEAIAAGEIRPDISVNTPAIIIGVIEGLFLQWMVDPDVFSLKDIAGAIIDTIFNGILARKR